MAKTREQVLAELNGGLAVAPGKKTREQVLAELNGAGEPPRGRETPGARSVAEQQIAAGDGSSGPLRTVDSNTDAEFENAHDLPEIGRRGAGGLAAGYSNASNIITMGAANKLRDMDSGSPLDAKTRAQLDRDYPGGALAGKGVGYLVSGTAGLGRVADTAARGAVGAVAPWLARTAAGRVGAAGAAGALSGGVQGGLIEGDAKTGAVMGGAFGAGSQALGEGARAAGTALRGDNWIGRFARARDSGRMAQVEQESASGTLPGGTHGQQQAAGQARDAIFARQGQRADQAGAEYRQAVEPHLQSPADIGSIDQGLLDASLRNRVPSTGAVMDEAFQAELGALRERLGRAPTNEDVLALRRSYQERAGFGAPNPTDQQERMRGVYGALRQGSRGASPEIAAADDAFANSRRGMARENDLILGNEDGPRMSQLPDEALPARPEAMRPADATRAANKLGRLGDDSVEGARAAPDLEELRQMDPEYAAALDDLEARKAFFATRYSLTNQMPTNLNKAVNFPLRFAQQNARAIGARVGLPASEAAARAAPAIAERAGSGVPFWLDRKRSKEKR